MSTEKKIDALARVSRRVFLKCAGTGIILPTIIGMIPEVPIMGPLGWRAYAQSQGKLSDEWWQIASKFGPPTGKYGKVGDSVTLTLAYHPYGNVGSISQILRHANILAKLLPQGSNIVWLQAPSGTLVRDKMMAGEVAFGAMEDNAGMVAGDKFFCAMISAGGYDMGESGTVCVRKDLEEQAKAKGPAFLDGQPVGVNFGSFAYRQALTWAYENDVKPNLTHQSIKAQEAGMKEKKIVGTFTSEPNASYLEENGIGSKWFNGLDMPCTCKKHNPQAAPHNFMSVASTLATYDWLRDRPDIIGAYLKGEEECRDMLTNAPDLAAYYCSIDIPEVNPAIVRVGLDLWVWDGRITPECRNHLKGVATMWRETGNLTSALTKDPDKFMDEWADDRFLRLAIRDLRAQGRWTSENLPGFPQEVRSDQLKRHSWKKYEGIKLQERTWNTTKSTLNIKELIKGLQE
jgi:NitT/TauT family transport system substrate-binding protein